MEDPSSNQIKDNNFTKKNITSKQEAGFLMKIKHPTNHAE